MRTSGSPERRTANAIELVQKFVVALKASTALGLIALGCYERVAVEGVRAKDAISERLLGIKEYLIGLLEGGDEGSSSGAALNLLSRLYEIDLDRRYKWIQISTAFAISMSAALSFIALYSGIHLDPLIPISLLPLYYLLPGFTPLEVPDPSLADAIANDLEKGGGRFYSLRHLGVYERISVDENDLSIPDYFRYALILSSKETSALMMRKTASILRELHGAVRSWREEVRSLKIILLSSIALLALINIGICFLGVKMYSEVPVGFIFSCGFTLSILISKHIGCSLESAIIYSISFSLGMLLLNY